MSSVHSLSADGCSDQSSMPLVTASSYSMASERFLMDLVEGLLLDPLLCFRPGEYVFRLVTAAPSPVRRGECFRESAIMAVFSLRPRRVMVELIRHEELVKLGLPTFNWPDLPVKRRGIYDENAIVRGDTRSLSR
ncbi:uncharacterized protein GLRG_00005 [Colletotrichum graminicola M1.001]|uniref:Uncharacterized protein n=1 Tax=Colletotrichum graminicola (strain M1.001 / M2 / FGSC 10212) TaxID=645133 RepID=E3Q2N2_COLGM|nr:uncharacterized protein GLRG_00005 [Colletotrichum graminicola M1.001]EFQ24861.1 hypothetical protein GLRG_00005 [Colletotrichum graminicola M1.001]